MALRFSEEPTHRLSPREAREFLRVHAEREARGTAADAPTVEDLAETLGITDDEARSILQETRARTVPPRAKAKTNSQQEARVAAIILGCAGVALACFLLVAPAPRIAPPLRAAPAPPALVVRPEPPRPAPLLEYSPPALSYAPPPPGFQVHIDSPILRIDTGTPALNDTTDYRLLGSSEAYGVQRRLAATCLDLIRSAPPGTWRGASEMGLSIALRGGRPTRLVVPLGQNPPTDDMRGPLTEIVAAAWPQIVR